MQTAPHMRPDDTEDSAAMALSKGPGCMSLSHVREDAPEWAQPGPVEENPAGVHLFDTGGVSCSAPTPTPRKLGGALRGRENR